MIAWRAGIVAVAVGFLAIAGIGYASHGSSEAPPQLDVDWGTSLHVAPSAPAVHCQAMLTSDDHIDMVVSNLAPGQSCTLDGKVVDRGTLAVHLYSDIDSSHPVGCADLAYTDNIASAAHPPSLAVGAKFDYVGTVSLMTAAGNNCQGFSVTFHITVTGVSD
ncbi:MAG: hypothetical protein ACREEC_01490 [Thermoplasmata archaeon]